MLQACRRTGFAEEAVAPRRIGRACLLIVEHLDGDIPLEVVVDGAMDAGDAARTDDLAQLVTIGEQARHRAGQRATWAGCTPFGVGSCRSPRAVRAAERMMVSATAYPSPSEPAVE